MTTTEGNKIIAEFMGWAYHKGHFLNPDTINDWIEMNYDINEVFPAVVEAIKWYNENKTK